MTISSANARGAGVKRTILIIEDEQINLELLKKVLEDDYELLTADTGQKGVDYLNSDGDSISLLLLDLNLPDMRGLDILAGLHEADPKGHIPVIVLTADKSAEVESLDLGASDFISKPYPIPEIIRARVRRTIELSENRVIIEQTEHDSLTGLFTREFFCHYAANRDMRYKAQDMDAAVVNINHFHLINERYGRAYADEVLKRIAGRIESFATDCDGLACRSEADNVLIYFPHRDNYAEVLDFISEGAAGEGKDDSVVRLRMGVYPNADRSIEVERRFDRAKIAADTVKSSFAKAVAIYDNKLHEKSLFNEQLLIDFPRALEEGQFRVFYQPKYDIRGDKPVLNSAEALVRWEHPEFGMISPGLFIELFEQNGLIQTMDSYVWRMAARQMRDWYDKLGRTVPISVNVSRVDMFDPDIKDSIHALIDEYGLSNRELMLEVTESAYTEDSEHIIRTVEGFREMGFFIEMDDFGTGYSSLNMLSNLPIDALKLDMQFIRSAFSKVRNTRMLEIVIDIADSLSVPVIAEGVETEEQLLALKEMGCDIVQGYYFSKPVPPEEFERFLTGANGAR